MRRNIGFRFRNLVGAFWNAWLADLSYIRDMDREGKK